LTTIGEGATHHAPSVAAFAGKALLPGECVGIGSAGATRRTELLRVTMGAGNARFRWAYQNQFTAAWQ
jgi:hypothetical protein